jgi:hypothetical protein
MIYPRRTKRQNTAGLPDPSYRGTLYADGAAFCRNFKAVFLAKRPWLKCDRDGIFNRPLPSKAKQQADDIAGAYLAIDKPARGLLKKMCESSGVDYAAVAYHIRLRRARAKARRDQA